MRPICKGNGEFEPYRSKGEGRSRAWYQMNLRASSIAIRAQQVHMTAPTAPDEETLERVAKAIWRQEIHESHTYRAGWPTGDDVWASLMAKRDIRDYWLRIANAALAALKYEPEEK